jgi:uncharacterized membrane protein
MAEEKEESSGGLVISPWTWLLFVIIAAFILLPAFMSGRGLFYIADPQEENTVENLEESKEPFFSIPNIIGSGNLELGKKATALKDLQVRKSPGGTILGLQEKITDGKIVEGPIEQFGTTWWRVNFEEAPSGWVEAKNLTSRSGWLKTVYFPLIFYRGYKPIGWILSVVLLIVVFIIKFKLFHEHKIARKKMEVQDQTAEVEKEKKTREVRGELGIEGDEEFKNTRWEHIQELMKSKSQGDWRSAIIEADIILDEMLRRMSYDGLTIGDMLKQVDPADFATLQQAWDAHKFRNEIAHTGSEFVISKEEAERVIALYQAVFNEFYYI